MGNRTSFNIFKSIEIIESILFDHNRFNRNQSHKDILIYLEIKQCTFYLKSA